MKIKDIPPGLWAQGQRGKGSGPHHPVSVQARIHWQVQTYMNPPLLPTSFKDTGYSQGTLGYTLGLNSRMVTQPLLFSIFIGPEWETNNPNFELWFLKGSFCLGKCKVPRGCRKKICLAFKALSLTGLLITFALYFFPFTCLQGGSLLIPSTVLSAHLYMQEATFSPPLLQSPYPLWNVFTSSFRIHELDLASSQNPSLIVQIKLTTVPLTCKVWTLKGSFNCKCHLVSSWP